MKVGLSGIDYAAEKLRRYNDYLGKAQLYQMALNPYDPAKVNSRQTSMNNAFKHWKSYDVGGFTGRGGRLEEAGTVHKGEFVIPKQHVNQSTGIPDMSALGFMFKGMQMPARSTTPTASAGNGIQLVEILPTQLQALIDASEVLVSLDMVGLTNTVNRINEQNNVRGSR